MSNYIYCEEVEFFYGHLGHFMQGKLGISADFFSFWLTDQRTGMLWTWDQRHLKEHVKLHLVSGGHIFLRGSWLLGAGGTRFPHSNLVNLCQKAALIVWPTTMSRPARPTRGPALGWGRSADFPIGLFLVFLSHRSTHRHGMDMGPLAY